MGQSIVQRAVGNGVGVGIDVETENDSDRNEGRAGVAVREYAGGVGAGGRVHVRVGWEVLTRVAVLDGRGDGVSAVRTSSMALGVGGAGASADRYTTRCSPAARVTVCVPKARLGNAILCMSVDVIGWSVGLLASTTHS